MAMSRVIPFVAACSTLGAQGGLFARELSTYKDYRGPFVVKGKVWVGQILDSQVSVRYEIDDADPRCTGTGNGKANSCGIHIHTGACAGPPGGHFYGTSSDPWTTVIYARTGEGIFDAANVTVNSGKTQAMNAGNSVVVHDIDGNRIACGDLRQDTATVGTAPVYASSFSKYPGYTGNLVVSGAATIYQTLGYAMMHSAVFLEYSLTGVDPFCSTSSSRSADNACGLRVHDGSCKNAVGGQYFKAENPWNKVMYFSGATGKTGASISEEIEVGSTAASMLGRSLVVYDFYGDRAACADLTSQAPKYVSMTNGAPGPAFGSGLAAAVLAVAFVHAA